VSARTGATPLADLRATLPGRGGALVTGSAKGIGREIVLALAERGLDVAVHYRSSEREALAVLEQAEALGVRARALQADVTDEREAQALIDGAAAALGGLRVLVNNVGDYHHGPLAELDAGTYHHMLASNLHAAFYTCQRAVPIMRAAGGGRVVNVGYAGAELLKARPGIVAYQIAKTGVILYTKALARSEAANGITANVVSPGVMDTSVTQPLTEIPKGRPGRLSELVGAVCYFLSVEAEYVTGTHLEVAGGWNL
jgi:3-oxoacyl-[acyl-carrier protein] reductase